MYRESASSLVYVVAQNSFFETSSSVHQPHDPYHLSRLSELIHFDRGKFALNSFLISRLTSSHISQQPKPRRKDEPTPPLLEYWKPPKAHRHNRGRSSSLFLPGPRGVPARFTFDRQESSEDLKGHGESGGGGDGDAGGG